MTGPRPAVQFTDEGEAADLTAFLARLIHYDRAAAVRLQASGALLGVFGRPASFEVLAIRTARLVKPYEHGFAGTLDVTVSAGDLLESVDERAATAVLPRPVTGPAWAGVLPPRGGWRPQPGLPGPAALRKIVAEVVAEFRARTQALAPEQRSRAALDQIGQDVWSRPVGDTQLPVRAVHAAHALGFLREPPAPPDQPGAPAPSGSGAPAHPADVPGSVALLASGAWLRLRTPYGSIAVRRSGTGQLPLTPA